MADLVPPSARSATAGHRGNGRRAHFIGICGSAMGGIAATLVRAGWIVTGSRDHCHSPMLDYLRDRGVPFQPRHLPSNVPADTDVVIVAKRIAESNPELLHVLQSGIPYRSFPE